MVMTLFLAELVGTSILIILGVGVCAGVSLKKSKSNNSGWVVITFGWGLAVAMGAYAVGQYSGAHLNPALTLAFALSGDLAWNLVPTYIIAQIIGAFIGAVIVYFQYLPHWKETKDQVAILDTFATSPAIPHLFGNFISEVIGTFVLVLGIFAIGANEFANGLNPFIVGFLIVSIGMSLGGTTGYAINPARDFGPRLAHALLPIPNKGKSNWGYAWIPIVGPIVGALLASVFYNWAFQSQFLAGSWFVLIGSAIIFVVIYAITKKNSVEKSDINIVK
jgi:glycerol uptake facilitator protein